MERTKLNTTDKMVKCKVLYDAHGYYIIYDNKPYRLISIDDFNKYNSIYSLPCNPRYKPWTKKKFNGATKPDVVSKFWGRYKPNQPLMVLIRITGQYAYTHREYQIK